MAVRTVIITGSNLFRVAAEEMGDAGQWWRIAALNGLKSPDLPGINVLKIPDTQAGAGYGIPSPSER